MSRIYSNPGETGKPRIDRSAVANFFEQRAKKTGSLGAVRAVIYQDKHPDLAERRDIAEKEALLPLLDLTTSHRVLDIGCGTGRWAEELLSRCAYYHGIDASEGLLACARSRFPETDRCRFTKASADAFSLESLAVMMPFDRVLCAGVLIYLNDDEIAAALQCFAKTLAQNGRILFREPVGVGRRLTIQEHYSDDLEQTYNAIYRTEEEITAPIQEAMPEPQFTILGSGDVYADPALNNRADTRQRWLLMERST